MEAHVAEILQVIARPEVVIHLDTWPGRERYFRRGSGPSTWLFAVVDFEARFAPVTSRRADGPRLRPGPASDDLRMDRPGQGVHMLGELLHLLRERRVLFQELF